MTDTTDLFALWLVLPIALCYFIPWLYLRLARRRSEQVQRANADLKRDQQPQIRRGATVQEIVARQQAHRRRNGSHVDPFGLDTQEPPGRAS